MTEYYPDIRVFHILAVIASGSLFCLRFIAVRAGHAACALSRPLRILSIAIDTALLTAALCLVAILPSAAFSNGWLAAKLALLPAYVGLGWLALRSGAGRTRQRVYFAGALLAFGLIFAIARTHDPLGPLRQLTGTTRAPELT